MSETPSLRNSLERINERYDMPADVEQHLEDIIAQMSDAQSSNATANQTASRIQQLLFYISSEHPDAPDADTVKNQLAEVYSQVVED